MERKFSPKKKKMYADPSKINLCMSKIIHNGPHVMWMFELSLFSLFSKIPEEPQPFSIFAIRTDSQNKRVSPRIFSSFVVLHTPQPDAQIDLLWLTFNMFRAYAFC